MATKEDVEKGLERVRSKFNDIKVTESLRRFNKNIQFNYPDINLSYVMKIHEGNVREITDGTILRPNVTVTLESTYCINFIVYDSKERSAI